MVHQIEDFYGVYLLYCMNPKFKGRTYIGYTVDPNRRIKQHNTGAHAGGAYRTSGRGPWEMVLIIHGFPNEVSGLRFEWAWQHPEKSRRLRDVPRKTSKELAFHYRWRVVCNMLRTAPWSGLSLTVRWLKQEFRRDFPPGLEPPLHMPVEFGPVVCKKVAKSSRQKKTASSASSSSSSQNVNPYTEDEISTQTDMGQCEVCQQQIQVEEKFLSCLHPDCLMKAHIICLAQHFLADPSQLLPVEGKCPCCEINLLWGELVRHSKGCHKNLSQSVVQQGANLASDRLTTVNESDDDSS